MQDKKLSAAVQRLFDELIELNFLVERVAFFLVFDMVYFVLMFVVDVGIRVSTVSSRV